MKSFSEEQWRLLLRGLFVAGTLVVLLAVASERAHYISYQWLGVVVVIVLGMFGALLGWYSGRNRHVDSKDMVQFSRMDTENTANEAQQSVPESDRILSPEEARKWLDDFLVQQQKETHS